MRLTGVVLAGACLVALSGCSLLPLPLAAPYLHARDLDGLVDEAPDGTRFTDDGSRSDLDEARSFASDRFNDGGGVPTTCEESYSASFLVAPGGSDDDVVVSLGSFNYDYESEGFVGVSARVFDNPRDIRPFIDEVAKYSETCRSGYELSALDPTWKVEKVTFATADGLQLPSRVSALYREEFPVERLDAQYRDTFLIYANIVVVVNCEVHSESPFDYDDCDAIAQQVAGSLVRLD